MQTEGGAVVPVRHAGEGRSLTSRASLNGVASGLDYGTRALVELLVSPLVVGGVGAAAYGAWRVLWQWSSYVWGASGRSAQALQFAIAHKQWTAEDPEKRQLVGAAVLVWLLFLPLMLVAGLAGVWLAPVLLDVPAEQVTPLRLAAAILAVDAMVMTLVTLPRSSLVGENLGYTRMGASAVLVAVGGGLLALAVQLDLGLPGLAGATLLTTLLTGVVFAVITRRRLSWFGIARPSRALARWFLGLSVWFLGWKFVLELMIASDVLVLAAFAPLTAVAAFALSKWVADSMAQVLSILVQATIPGIGAYLGSGALDVAARLRGEVMSLVWVVGTGIGTTVLVWNGTFVGLWVGEHLYAGRTTTLLVVVLALQLASSARTRSSSTSRCDRG
jgi:O-antigen/teichoic acid export membrane protein